MLTARFGYVCSECGRAFERDSVRYLCPHCSIANKPGGLMHGVLEARFDFSLVNKEMNPAKPDFELLSAVEKEYYPTFPVGRTPLVRASLLGDRLGLNNLWLKNDGQNPTGSLKDRASFLVVAEANRIGENEIVAASTGNAASALAGVCASAGKRAVIYVPATAPKAKLVQMRLYGADVRLVNGTYDQAFALSIEHTESRGGYNRNTAYNPLTIEGKKTVSLEIFEQLGEAPDYVVVPVGDGAIIGGVHKGFCDLRSCGLIGEVPRLVCVQAETSDAIHRFVETGVFSPASKPATIADSISVGTPANLFLARRAVVDSGGFSLTVGDAQIMEAQSLLAATTGIFAEPAAAAAVAGIRKCGSSIGADASIVVLITGHGLKDIESAEKTLSMISSKNG